MNQNKIQEILNQLNGDFGYTQWFKDTVTKMLPSLQFDYDLRTICENREILPAVDRLMCRYIRFYPVVCTWHDVGPKPFDGDFMAGCLDDDNDIFIVLFHPSDERMNLGIHVKCYDDTDSGATGITGFELLNDVSCEYDGYVSEKEITDQIDEIVKQWTE